MRILLIAEISASGGTRTYCEQLIPLLRRQGAEVCALIHGPMDDPGFSEFAHKQGIKWQCLPDRTHWASRSALSQVWEISQLTPLILRYRPNFIIASVGTPGNWLTPFLLPIPVLHILHTVVNAPGRFLRPCLSLLLSRLSAKHRLVTVSSYAADQIRQHWKSEASFIYNCTPYTETAPSPLPLMQTKHIVTAGHVIGYKNPQVWLNVAQKVLAQHPDAVFSWYGEGAMLENMRTQAKGISGVNFCGLQKDMQSIYDSAAIYFHPSLLENHSIAILEAMHFGLPCVASNVGGIPESVVHEITGYTEDPNDAETFANRICALLENPDLAQQMGIAAKERIQQHFMPDQWEKAMLEMIEKCIKGVSS